MSIFKKIIICFIFLIPLIGNLAVPKRVIAADPTITFVRTTNTQDATTSKWLWEFRIDTSFVDDNTLGYATLYKEKTLVKKTPFVIIKNVGHYTTDSTLDPGTKYMVDFSIDVGNNLPIGKDFSEKTGGTAPPLDCTPKVLDPTSNTCIDPPANKTTKTTYTMLAPLPGLGLDGTDKTIDTAYDATNNPCPFGYYLNIMIKLFLGICGVLAVIMIIWGGVQYMTNELISNKEEGRKSITNAIFGLLLALGSYIILNTLNPDLLNICLNNLPLAEITISPETTETTIGAEGKTTIVNGQTLTACDTGELTTINFMGSQIQVNKAVSSELQDIDTNWNNTNDQAVKDYGINSVLGYNCRSVKNQPTKTSAHAFGIAIDINPGTNPYSSTTCSTDMPPGFVKLFTDKGWGWGGNWNSIKDPMHFSKLSSETGSNSPCGNVSGEKYDSPSAVGKIIYVLIKNYDNTKNHNILLTEPSPNLFYEEHNNLTNVILQGTDGKLPITLSDSSYNKLKGTTVSISVTSAGASLGTKSLLIQ